jgi:hypothetical protein
MSERFNVKEYLSQAHYIDQRINSKLEQVMSLRSLTTRATATLSDMPGSATRNIHSMEDVIAKLVDLENEINSDIEYLVGLKMELTAVVKKVKNPEFRTLLELRYLCFKTWEQIAVDMDYDLRWIYRMHKNALDAVREIIFKTRHEKPL